MYNLRRHSSLLFIIELIYPWNSLKCHIMCTVIYHYCSLSTCSCVISPSLAIRGGGVRWTPEGSNLLGLRTLLLGTPRFAVVGLWPLLPLVDGRVAPLWGRRLDPCDVVWRREGHSVRWGIASIRLRQHIYKEWLPESKVAGVLSLVAWQSWQPAWVAVGCFRV